MMRLEVGQIQNLEQREKPANCQQNRRSLGRLYEV